jgi:KDO2-lipid IV(A) lauroyltransferase
MGGWRQRLGTAAFSAGWRLVCRLPESTARGLFSFGADIAWRRQGHGVQTLEGNLVRVLRTLDAADAGAGAAAKPAGAAAKPAGTAAGAGYDAGDPAQAGSPPVDGGELRTMSRAVMRSYARYYLETFRLQAIPDERIRAGMHVNQENVDRTLEHLKAGRGVIYALPHMGDFEQAGRWVILAGAGSFTTVAERLANEDVYERFLAFRQGLGMEVLPTTGGPHPFGVMAQRLRAGKLVCLVADRDLSDTGVEVDFFGEKALFPTGPAALAVRTGAALMPVTCWFVGEDEWGAHVWDEIEVPAEGDRKAKAAAMTQALARVFERGISEHPEDWHMLQKVFARDLDPERLARNRARHAGGGAAAARAAAAQETAAGDAAGTTA